MTKKAAETKPAEGASPEDHHDRMVQASKEGAERLDAMGGERVEIELLEDAIVDSELLEAGSVVEVNEVQARDLVHLKRAKYNSDTFTEKKKPQSKKTRAKKE